MLSELLHADDLVLISETIKGLINKLLKWKDDLESKGLKVNLLKTKATELQNLYYLKVKLTHVGFVA